MPGLTVVNDTANGAEVYDPDIEVARGVTIGLEGYAPNSDIASSTANGAANGANGHGPKFDFTVCEPSSEPKALRMLTKSTDFL